MIAEDKDPMGAAIYDYFRLGKAGRLRVFSPQFDEDEIPVAMLFRSYEEMPLVEQRALQLASGHILDAGAGSGCHAFALRQMGKDALAIDVSPLAVRTMQERGLDARLQDLFDTCLCERFDTILMLMNGSGIIGKLEYMGDFFQQMKRLLNPGGCILMDSTDVKYLFEEEDGSFLIDLAGGYYGEIDFRMQYKQVKGDLFHWLYIDFDTLSLYATQYGFRAEKIEEGEHYAYLAKLSLA